MIFQDPLTSLNPLYRIGDQLVETIRTHTNLSEQAARKRADRSPRRSRHSRARQAYRRLSARILRRHAPAGRHRARDLRRTGADHRRRAHDCARRVGAGPDHLPDKTPRARSRHRRHARDPRHGGDRRDLGPRRRDVFRPDRRNRSCKGCRAEPATSLRQGPDGRDPDACERTPSGWSRSPARCRGFPPFRRAAPFNPRCALAFDRCRIERPEPIAHGTQAVACHLYDTAAKDTAA